MASKQLSLVHLVRYPSTYNKEAETKYPTILALHGRGSNEEDLIGLAPYLPGDFLWISPRGTFELGPEGYEWFQVIQIGKPDPLRLANAIQTIDHFIEELIDSYPVDADKLYLLGFSQGTVVSLSYALTKPERVAGVIAQSGYIPQESGLQIDVAGVNDKPFLLTHGIQDQLLPVAWARRSRDILEQLGANFEYHELNMGHQISAESLEVVAAWLENQLRK